MNLYLLKQMKTSLLPLLTLFLTNTTQAQQIYYDAIQLSELLQSGNTIEESLEATLILARYTSEGIPSFEFIEEAFEDNPFISAGGETPIQLKRAPEDLILNRENLTTIDPNRILGNVGGVDVTGFAFGLADFLVKRLRQEMSITFMEEFRTFILKEEFEDVRDLFPKTFLIAKDFDFINYAAFIESLRVAIDDDFKSIYGRLPEIIENHPEVFNDLGQRQLFESALLLVTSVVNRTHPGELFQNLAAEADLSKIHPELPKAFQALNAFSQALRSNSFDDYWVSRLEMLQLFRKDQTFAIFLGLMYQSLNLQADRDWTFLLEKLRANATDFLVYKPYVKGLMDRIGTLEQILNNLEEKDLDDLEFEDYNLFFTSLFSTLDFATSKDVVASIGIDLDSVATAAISKLLAVSELSSDLFLDANMGNYHSVIVDIVTLLDTLNVVGETQRELFADLIRYGSFMAGVVKAQNTAEVEVAIEAIALPVGSARIKRTTWKSIDLNAYIGLFGAGEWISGTSDNGSFDAYRLNGAFGISAPLGVTISNGKKGRLEASSDSWFLTVIDIGALAAFRFGDETTEALPKVKLENIFAPGFYYVRGFQNSPVSMGIGGQFGPFLRGVTKDAAGNLDTRKNPNFRLGVFIAVDIPVFNFSARTAKRK